MIRNFLNKIAYPSYKCEDCIGMIQYGCYCDSQGASAPGIGPKWYHRILRKILERNKNEFTCYTNG